jgi:hypothetical protein
MMLIKSRFKMQPMAKSPPQMVRQLQNLLRKLNKSPLTTVILRRRKLMPRNQRKKTNPRKLVKRLTRKRRNKTIRKMMMIPAVKARTVMQVIPTKPQIRKKLKTDRQRIRNQIKKAE